jgi:hypothetical protein|nr:MAG TPA: hypothetical protein [Bacteriophage sp.]
MHSERLSKRIGSDFMKISEMNNCIEEMRKCYKFNDDKTEIRLGDMASGSNRYVTVGTKDENGTQIEMTRIADKLEEADYCLR